MLRCGTGLALRALGEAAGGMDYPAVRIAVKRFEQQRAQDKALRRMVEGIWEES